MKPMVIIMIHAGRSYPIVFTALYGAFLVILMSTDADTLENRYRISREFLMYGVPWILLVTGILIVNGANLIAEWLIDDKD